MRVACDRWLQTGDMPLTQSLLKIMLVSEVLTSKQNELSNSTKTNKLMLCDNLMLTKRKFFIL